MGPVMERIFEGVRQRILEAREEKGRQIGAAEMTLDMLRAQVGRLDRVTVEQVRALPVASLKRLGKALLRFKMRADLDAWLRRNAAQPISKGRVRRIASNGGK